MKPIEIQCEFITLSYNSRPKYYALSYTCSNGQTIAPILVNKKVFEIGKNLELALCCLQPEYEDVFEGPDAENFLRL